MTSNTLYLLVTCSLEQSRFDVYKRVHESLLAHPSFDKFNDSLIAFDSASTIPAMAGLLGDFKRVVTVDRNVGYWTAIDWTLRNYERLVGPRKYIYIIESDCVHHDMHRLTECEAFLDANPDVGMVRTQEFVVAERELYDKDRPSAESRKYAWQRQTNVVTGERVQIARASGDIHTSNFLPVLCGLSRIDAMQETFEQLRDLKQVDELVYQRLAHKKHANVGLIDGGLFDARFSYESNAISGSWNPGNVGYRRTRIDRIEPNGSYVVHERVK